MKSLDEQFQDFANERAKTINWEEIEDVARARASAQKKRSREMRRIGAVAATVLIALSGFVGVNRNSSVPVKPNFGFTITTLTCRYVNQPSREIVVNRKVERSDLVNMCNPQGDGGSIPAGAASLTESDFEFCEITKSRTITVWFRDRTKPASHCG